MIDDPKCSIFIQAKNYTPANRTQADVRNLAIHTAECAQIPGAAVSLAKWAAGHAGPAPEASWTYAVAPGSGPNAITQSVREKDIAWGARGANRFTLHIELAGHASDPAEHWLEGPGLEVLTTGARLAGRICKRWGIPVERLDVARLKAGERGIIGHDTVTHAFRKSTHTDPGKTFPWAEFLRIASEEYNQ